MKKKKETEEKTPTKKKGALRENIEAICIAIALALFIRAFIVQAFKIPSGSMKETLQIGDHILVNKFIYGIKLPFADTNIIPISDPDRGDIVVFKFPEDPKKDFIKRVVGVAGDTVKGIGTKVYINDKEVDNSDGHAVYKIAIGKQATRDFGPITIPENSLFVMGDNRDHSYDSRFWGFVNLKALKGKAFMIYWSWDKENFPGGWEWMTWWNWVRWNRFGKILR
ncbi:signal peptidase I [Desulfococcaceae bacterium HSG7]|nr:signal peptidase I [Desulfococcaceae bacterium HSG7]